MSYPVINALHIALDAKDPSSARHCMNVSFMAKRFAEYLNLSSSDAQLLYQAAYIHDIGKIGIPDAILNYPGPLTEAGFSIIHAHAEIGAYILLNGDVSETIVSAVRHHHEHWNGTGYPARLTGSQIPKLARILAVLDVVDAMCGQRCYRQPASLEQCKEELRRCAGLSLDPDTVRSLLLCWDNVTQGVYC